MIGDPQFTNSDHSWYQHASITILGTHIQSTTTSFRWYVKAGAAPSLVEGLFQESLHLDDLEATFILCLFCFGLCPATNDTDAR